MSDYRSRNTLARSKLAEFESFCASKGWIVSPNSGPYEVLRMRPEDEA